MTGAPSAPARLEVDQAPADDLGMQPQQQDPRFQQPPMWTPPPAPTHASGIQIATLILLVANLLLTLYVFFVAKHISDAAQSVTSLFN